VSFISASFTVNADMDVIIKSAARMLSDRIIVLVWHGTIDWASPFATSC
jgi:hypothetical protein